MKVFIDIGGVVTKSGKDFDAELSSSNLISTLNNGCLDSIVQLTLQGHVLHFNTACTTKHMYNVMEQLRKIPEITSNIPERNWRWCGRPCNKAVPLRDGDVMIDDNLDHCAHIKKYKPLVKVLWFYDDDSKSDSKHLSTYNGMGIVRVTDWNDLCEKIV